MALKIGKTNLGQIMLEGDASLSEVDVQVSADPSGELPNDPYPGV